MSVSVSALIVTYNHARYIETAIRSALGQSRPPDEIVVVDDGSSDDTVARVKSVGDPRIRVLAGVHRGVGALSENYEAGVAACRGELVALLEGDDRWPSDKLETQVPSFDDPGVVLAHGLYAVIGAKGARLHGGVWPSPRPPAGKYRPLPFMLRASYIMAVTAIIRRDALSASGGFRQLEGTPHWDYPTFLALAMHGDFVFVPRVVGEWRKHEASATFRLAGADLGGVDLSLRLALEARELSPNTDLPSRSEIARAWSDAYAQMIWQNARILLVNGRHADARRLALSALTRPASLSLRLRLVLAAGAGTCRLSVEPIARAIGGESVFRELD